MYILIAVSNDVPSRLITCHTDIELLSVEINLSPKLLVVCLYIPPNCSYDYQHKVLTSLQLLPTDCDVILTGDFNVPDINWSTFSANSSFSISICNRLSAQNYVQMVMEPTHHRGNILDLILTNSPHRLLNINVDSSELPLKSDHFLITVDIASKTPNAKVNHGVIESKFNYLKADLPSLFQHLSNSIGYLLPTVHAHAELVWVVLKQGILVSCKKCIPKIRLPSKPFPRWFNSTIRHQLNRIHTIRRCLRKNPTQRLLSKLNSMEISLQSQIQASKDEFLSNLVVSFINNPKKLYSYLNNLNNSKYKPQFIIYNGNIIDNVKQKVSLFNDFFNSTFTSSNFILPDMSLFHAPTTQLSSIEFTDLEVYEVLTKLDPTKASGCDMISPFVLKHCANILANPLCYLFTICLNTSTVPQEWKIHKICPIPKKGNLQEITNYHPISLLCTVSKVLERLIYNKVINFIRPKLSKHQFGFLKNRSCLSQLLTSFTYIFDEVDKGTPVDVVYLDLMKAFDSVPHDELLFKMWRLGITGPLWYWFKAYLTNRQHYVSIDGISSNLLPVLSGVPQGSILGPLLFLIYINDLPEQINYASCYLFADDTKLLKSIHQANDCLTLQTDINNLCNWCKDWKLMLNGVKCSMMRISLSQHTLTCSDKYQIFASILQSGSCQRDLGIMVSNDLSWSSHYNKICSKAYRSLNLIQRTLPPNSTLSLKKQLYLTLVRSHLSYCSKLWSPRLVKDIKSIERVQRKATKYILNDYTSDYRTRLLSLNLLPLMYWFELQDIMFLVKHLKHPSDNLDIHKYISFTHSVTRMGSSGNRLKISFRRTSAARHFYYNRVVRLWNFIPVNVIDLSQSLLTIKHRIYSFCWSYFKEKFNSTNSCTYHLVCPCNNCRLS